MKSKMHVFLLALLISIASFGKEVHVGVRGMVCAFCAQGITKKFNAEPAVQSVDVNLSTKVVRLVLKEDQDMPDDRITQILTDSGYNVDKIERQ